MPDSTYVFVRAFVHLAPEEVLLKRPRPYLLGLVANLQDCRAHLVVDVPALENRRAEHDSELFQGLYKDRQGEIGAAAVAAVGGDGLRAVAPGRDRRE